MPTRTKILAMLVPLLLAPALSGCFGDDKRPDAAPLDATSDERLPTDDVPDPGDTGYVPSNEPLAHKHHLWKNGLTEVWLWTEADVVFKTLDAKYLGDHDTLTYADLDLEMDKDSVSDPEADNAAPEGRADIVFAGTGRIEVRFPKEFFGGAQLLALYWKPADTNAYEGPITAGPGETHNITMRPGMADSPHQNAVSRWRFRLIAVDDQEACRTTDGKVCPPAVALPDTAAAPERTVRLPGLTMKAVKGSDAEFDPPHPDFWGLADVLSFQTIEGSFEADGAVVQTPVVRERHPSLYDLAPKPGDVVPPGTERVQITVGWTMEQAPPGFLLRPRYHGADTLDYAFATPDGAESTGPTASNLYVVHNTDEQGDKGLADPPYGLRSFWRFELVPAIVTPDGEATDNIGVLTGTYTIAVQVHRDPTYPRGGA